MKKLLLLTFAVLYLLLISLLIMPFPGVLAGNQEICTGESESMASSNKKELSGSTESGSGNVNKDNSSSDKASSKSEANNAKGSNDNICTGKEEIDRSSPSIEVKSSDYKSECLTDQEDEHPNSNSISRCFEEVSMDLDSDKPDNEINITGKDNSSKSKGQLDSEESFDAISSSKDYPDPVKKNLGSFSGCLDITDSENISETVSKAANNYTVIASQDDFDLIRNNLNGYFKLINDINLTGTWNPIGQENNSSPFKGIFDGQGYSISNLLIDSDKVPGSGYAGFFGYTSGATIKNVNLMDAEVSGMENVGALVGKAHDTVIEKCLVNGEVSGSGNNVGGLVGQAVNTNITKSSVSGLVAGGGNRVGGLVGYMTGSIPFGNANIANSSSDARVSGVNGIGGLVGFTFAQCRISDSYAKGTVEGDSSVGGLAGGVSGNTSIANCYASTQIILNDTFARDIGGLVGHAYSQTTDQNNYWDTFISGLTESALGIGLTKEQMLLLSFYEGWDFEQTWHIKEGINSPILKWQLEQEKDNDSEKPDQDNGNDNKKPGQENRKVDCSIWEKRFSPGLLVFSVDNTTLLFFDEANVTDLIRSKLNEAGLLIELVLAKELADTDELYYIMGLLQEVHNLLINHAKQINQADLEQFIGMLAIKTNLVLLFIEVS